MTGRNTDAASDPAVVVLRAYELALWVTRKAEKFPRTFRTTIGDRLVARSLDVMESLVEAAYASDKRVLLEQASRRVNSLRYLLRLAGDLGLLSGDSQEFAAARLLEIGRMVGGWRKSRGSPQ